VVAGRIAEMNGDPGARNAYYDHADWMQANVDNWTYTTTGPHGNGRYYIRIDPSGNPNDGQQITIGNGGRSHDERSIVDAGFLELVRHGVKRADDPEIVELLPEVDSQIKQTIAGRGDYFFRYNRDGYGENLDGSNWDGTGKGRLWPLLTGERGHYVIATGGSPSAYLSAMRRAANSGYQIPEQVWDLDAPAGFTPGTPTKSMTPLGWSMAEYVTLAVSARRGAIADQLDIVRQRYP
jgi:glucoamylase